MNVGSLIEWIKANIEESTAFLLVVVTFFAVIAKVKKLLSIPVNAVVRKVQRGRKIDEFIDAAAEQLKGIHYQLHTNGGGSLKDEVGMMRTQLSFLLEQEGLNFRNLPYPAFRCDSEGKNITVSNAYLELFGLNRRDALSGMNWHGFIHPEDIDSYFMAFQLASETESDFRRSARYLDGNGDSRGTWAVEAIRFEDGNYLGRFRAADDLSRKISNANHWR